jgi:hypothetical protein
MSTYTQKSNTGVLFKNNRKEKETHPVMNGTALIDGKTYRIAAWTKYKGEERYLSLSFSDPESAERATTPTPAPEAPPSDDLPF